MDGCCELEGAHACLVSKSIGNRGRVRNGLHETDESLMDTLPPPPVPKAKTEMRPQDAVPGSKGLAGLKSNHAGSTPGDRQFDRPSSARRASERRVWATPSPQERAAKHAAKVKARDSRLFESSPGPGAYSTNGRTPRGGASLQSLGGGRAVFRSRSLQRQKVDSIGIGPGAYNAADALDNVSRSSFLSAGSSFNRAARAGQGGFGGLGSWVTRSAPRDFGRGHARAGRLQGSGGHAAQRTPR